MICISCRSEPVPSEYLSKFPGFSMSDQNRPGISSYIHLTLKSLTKDMTAAKEVIEASRILPRRAEGVFLWARFAVDELIQGHCEGETLDELSGRMNAILKDLEDVYGRMISRANAQSKKEALMMLQIVSAWRSGRPLLDDFLVAVDVAMKMAKSFRPKINASERGRFIKRLRAKVPGLLEVIDEGRYSKRQSIKMIHKTVSNYLDDRGWESLGGSLQRQAAQQDSQMIAICGQYFLMSLDYALLPERNKHAVYKYAVQNLIFHAASLEETHQQSSYRDLQRYLKNGLFEVHHHARMPRSHLWTFNPTGLALLYGLERYYEEALVTQPDTDPESFGDLLNCAILSGCTETNNYDGALPKRLIPLVLERADVQQRNIELAFGTWLKVFRVEPVEILLRHESSNKLRLTDHQGHEVTIFWLLAGVPDISQTRNLKSMHGHRVNWCCSLFGIFSAFVTRGTSRREDIHQTCGPDGTLLETLIHGRVTYTASGLPTGDCRSWLLEKMIKFCEAFLEKSDLPWLGVMNER